MPRPFLTIFLANTSGRGDVARLDSVCRMCHSLTPVAICLFLSHSSQYDCPYGDVHAEQQPISGAAGYHCHPGPASCSQVPVRNSSRAPQLHGGCQSLEPGLEALVEQAVDERVDGAVGVRYEL